MDMVVWVTGGQTHGDKFAYFKELWREYEQLAVDIGLHQATWAIAVPWALEAPPRAHTIRIARMVGPLIRSMELLIDHELTIRDHFAATSSERSLTFDYLWSFCTAYLDLALDELEACVYVEV